MVNKSFKKKRFKKAIGVKKNIERELTKRSLILKKIKIKKVSNVKEKAIERYKYKNGISDFIHYSDDFINRITLNYIRHNCSNYEQLLKTFSNNEYCYDEFKKDFNGRINKVYKGKI